MNAEGPGIEYSEQEVDFCLRELAANIIRVVRGAGRPFEIGMHAQALLKALAEYRAAAGHYPPMHNIQRMLRLDAEPDRFSEMPEEGQSAWRAQQAILRGALQVAASRLLDQVQPERSGEAELVAGIRKLEEAEAAARRRREAEQEAALAALRAAQKARRLELKERRAAEEARKAAARERRAKEKGED